MKLVQTNHKQIGMINIGILAECTMYNQGRER